jgi:hypothetical protein
MQCKSMIRYLPWILTRGPCYFSSPRFQFKIVGAEKSMICHWNVKKVGLSEVLNYG